MKKTQILISIILSVIFLSTNSYAKHVKSYNIQTTGQQIADYMNSNYQKTVENCGSATRPAFLCSGVLFRATNPDTTYNSWDPSPSSNSSGGVSFSYLRKDAKFTKLAYGYLNGFVFSPYSYAAEGKNTNIDILCMFPIDADSNARADKGCGANSNYPSVSDSCQSQNITTADEWISHYNSTTGNKHQHQCGFSVSEHSSYNGTKGFYQAILSMSKITSGALDEQNEVRLATWGTDTTNYPATLPIEAFFYIYQQDRIRTPIEKGIVAAKNDQSTYYKLTGLWVPIVRMSLPLNSTEDATFSYSDADQEITQSSL